MLPPAVREMLAGEGGEHRESAIWSDAPPCPFCGEDGFDWPGLAAHTARRCETVDRLLEAQDASLKRFHEEALETARRRRAEAERERARAIVAEIAPTMQCNCDLDKWEPERLTGHSFVCRIHKAAVARLAKPEPA